MEETMPETTIRVSDSVKLANSRLRIQQNLVAGGCKVDRPADTNGAVILVVTEPHGFRYTMALISNQEPST